MSDFLADLKGMVSDAYNKAETTISNGKKSFGRALVDATNLQPADMRSLPVMKQSQAELREYAAEAADMLLPGTTDALPIGKIVKAGKGAAKMVEAIKKIESANLPEMTRRGYELLKKGEPIAERLGKVIVKESAPQKLGKVIVKP